MGRIFLNYRRTDSQWAMGRVYDWLGRELGEEEVFMDFSGIPAATDFRVHLTTELNRCDVVIAGIGTRWLDILRERVATEDHVLMELEMAFERGVPVLPLLLGAKTDVHNPAETDLPTSIASLSRLNSVRVEPGVSFQDDMTRLLSAITDLRQTRDHPEERKNPFGMTFAGIPATSGFARGARSGDDEAVENEAMQCAIPIRAFWLGNTPVTVRQYRAVMGEPAWQVIRSRYPADAGFEHQQQSDKAIACLSAQEAAAFCQRLNEVTEQVGDPLPHGYRYRLPSETEWEYACRSTIPDQSRYDDLDRIAWVAKTDPASFSDVAKRASNPWGLFDMLGLVFEWCDDDSAEGKTVVRGGSFADPAVFARASARSLVRSNKASTRIGFRVALAMD